MNCRSLPVLAGSDARELKVVLDCKSKSSTSCGHNLATLHFIPHAHFIIPSFALFLLSLIIAVVVVSVLAVGGPSFESGIMV